MSKVMVISRNKNYDGPNNMPHPPIGFVGEIIAGIDHDGDYDVMFDNYLCPIINDQSWILHKSMIIFIDKHTKKEIKVEEIELVM